MVKEARLALHDAFGPDDFERQSPYFRRHIISHIPRSPEELVLVGKGELYGGCRAVALSLFLDFSQY